MFSKYEEQTQPLQLGCSLFTAAVRSARLHLPQPGLRPTFEAEQGEPRVGTQISLLPSDDPLVEQEAAVSGQQQPLGVALGRVRVELGQVQRRRGGGGRGRGGDGCWQRAADDQASLWASADIRERRSDGVNHYQSTDTAGPSADLNGQRELLKPMQVVCGSIDVRVWLCTLKLLLVA